MNFAQSPSATPGIGGAPAGSASPAEANMFQRSSHPIALFFHFIFGLAAVALYLLANFVTTSFVIVFIISILLLSFQFWTIKNVTGRLLVGLRWWNQVNDDGTSAWVFESRDSAAAGEGMVNPSDAKIFWWSLYGTPVVWALLSLMCILRLNFKWLPVVVVALILNIANLVGYTRCDKDARAKWQGLANTATGAASGGSGGITGWLFGRMLAGGASGLFGGGNTR